MSADVLYSYCMFSVRSIYMKQCTHLWDSTSTWSQIHRQLAVRETQNENGFCWAVVQCCGTDSMEQYAIVSSVVMVNQTKTAMFYYLWASSSPQCFRPNTAWCLCFYFFIAYTRSTNFYLLHDDVIRSSEINLHPTFYLVSAHHHSCPYSVQHCVWPLIMTAGEIQTKPLLTVWLPLPLPFALVSHTYISGSWRLVLQLRPTRQIIIWSNSRGGVMEQLTHNYNCCSC